MNEKLLEIAHDLMLQGQAARAEVRTLHSTIGSMQQGINHLQAELADTQKKWGAEIELYRRKLRLCDMPGCWIPGCTSDHK